MDNFDLQKTLSTMVLLVDSREKPTEQAKKRWCDFGLPYRIQALKSGDYAAEFTLPSGETISLENVALIERKLGLTEICGNFCQNRDRFIREFERIKEAGARVYIVIENGSWENVYSGKYRSQMHPNALIANLTAWMARYNAHIVFCKAETFPKLCKEILYREAKEYLQDMETDSTHTERGG
jgi:ERCC4-type nuclease